jgi:hypothetical protein
MARQGKARHTIPWIGNERKGIPYHTIPCHSKATIPYHIIPGQGMSCHTIAYQGKGRKGMQRKDMERQGMEWKGIQMELIWK